MNFRWACLHEVQAAIFGQDEQQVADAQNLAVAVAAAFPSSLAAGELDALQNAFGEAVNVAVDDDDIGEFGLQDAGIFPHVMVASICLPPRRNSSSSAPPL